MSQTSVPASGERLEQMLPLRACLLGIRAGRWLVHDHGWKYCRYESCALAPPLDENGCKTVQCNVPSYRQSVFLQAATDAEHHALMARGLCDSAHQKNTALRISGGQYNLKYGRTKNDVARLHEARHRAGAGKCPLGQRRALRCR